MTDILHLRNISFKIHSHKKLYRHGDISTYNLKPLKYFDLKI